MMNAQSLKNIFKISCYLLLSIFCSRALAVEKGANLEGKGQTLIENFFAANGTTTFDKPVFKGQTKIIKNDSLTLIKYTVAFPNRSLPSQDVYYYYNNSYAFCQGSSDCPPPLEYVLVGGKVIVKEQKHDNRIDRGEFAFHKTLLPPVANDQVSQLMGAYGIDAYMYQLGGDKHTLNKLALYDKVGQFVIVDGNIYAPMEGMPTGFINATFDLKHNAYGNYFDNAVARDAYYDVQATAWFMQGSPRAAHKIYVMADPDCPVCKAFYETVQPLIDANQLAIRWVLVSFLSPDSKDKALTILNSKDPVKLWVEYHNAIKNIDTDPIIGGMTINPNPSAKAINGLTSNLYFADFTSVAMTTPLIIYQDIYGNPQLMLGFDAENAGNLLNTISGQW